MKKISIILAAVVISLTAYAQNINTDTLLVYTKYTNQGVMIKIAPQLATTWLKGAEYGYEIFRSELGLKEEPILITQKPLKPFTDEEYAKLENGDTIKEFQQLAIFDNMAKNKVEMSMIDRIQFVDNLQNDYGFYYLLASRIRDIAKTSGLEFVDKTAKKDKVYIYSVSIVDDKEDSRRSISIVNTSENKLFLPELVAIEGDHDVKFNWIHKGGVDPILSYYLEVSDDNKSFQRVNTAPYYYNPESKYESIRTVDIAKILSHNDSLEINYKPYYYRLVGVDIWAMEHISDEVVKVIGVDKTPPDFVKKINSKHNIEEKSINFNWDYDPPADFGGFKFFVSQKSQGGFEAVNDTIYPTGTNEFTLKNVIEGTPIYFHIVCFDTNGNYSFNSPKFTMLPDLYPPTIPIGFSAIIDTNGVMVLSWDANPELDIKGYRVLASNSKQEKLISSTGLMIRDTFYVDTVNIGSLAKHKYFRLEAVDNNFNTSEPTDYITVALPDKIKPSAGSINSIIVEDRNIIINWIPSTSNDIASQQILRRSADSEPWNVVATVADTTTTYIDQPSEKGNYEYSIIAIDLSENKGIPTYTFAVKLLAKKEDISISNFKAKKKNGSVQLSWNASDASKVNYYIIYRKDKNNDLRMIASVKDMTYIDHQVVKDGQYRYYIVAQDNSGKHYSASKIQRVGI